ncbi:aspartate/glutamate racemase family protein [Roseobacter sp. N2S]|uniref:aspartate/glutamate racemase family protein n=1 Tax=Roseobacter sp. N2S TaxID=2663844 RepID=UPI00285AB801|nr:aspartate/glutamate racemase family protein [Roseobacter sp. N2S]MDR6263245.1 Asp/Glu/hydantoin racemase [Roseobacter sp. N2S]
MTGPNPAAVGPIVVINPNSSGAVTAEIAKAVAPLQIPNGPVFETVDIRHGPATIATMEHAAQAALNVAELVKARPDASAFVVACFSDPGVDLCRTLVSQPVFGIQEAGILTAMAQADMFGIIALGPASVARHRLRIRQMGVESRLAGELPLDNVSAEDAGSCDAAYQQTLSRGKELREMGATALILGCAGFSPRREQLQNALGIRVVDPVKAAAAMALGAVDF